MKLSRTGQESAHLGTGASYFLFLFFIRFYSFLYISDWLTIYDRQHQQEIGMIPWPMAREAEKDPAFFCINLW